MKHARREVVRTRMGVMPPVALPAIRPRGGEESPRTASAGAGAVHHFTVDVEEYFHVSAFEPHVDRSAWDRLESRVVASTSEILDELAAHGASATFFVLGWVAERYPELVRRIRAQGHEVASHGWDHRRVMDQTPAEFRASVRRSKELLERIAGRPVLGFRAPSFSIVPGREWALEILSEEGYRYDSSLFPIRRRGYGYPGAPRDPHMVGGKVGGLAEFPLSTVRVLGAELPSGGGAYFRHLPYAWTRAALKAAEARGVPGMFYLHPWEVDPDQPRVQAPPLTRLRHYGGVRGAGSKLRRLLREFRFRSIAETLESW